MDITLTGMDELQARMDAFPGGVASAIAIKSQAMAQALADKVGEKLDGQVLNSVTGKLKSSIASSVDEDGDQVSGNVFVDGDVPYAAIQEYGGMTKAHIIEVAAGKALAFSYQGKTQFFRSVNHPGSVIPERSYLRSSLEDMQDDIVAGMGDALSGAVEE